MINFFIGGYTKINLNPRHYSLISCETPVLSQLCESGKSWPYTFLNYSKYSMESCKLDCAINLSLNFCDCVLPLDRKFLKDVFHHQVCRIETMKHCFYDIATVNGSKEFNTCSATCRTPCDYWEFVPSSASVVRFSSLAPISDAKETVDDIGTRLDQNRMLKDGLILDIAFTDLYYTEVALLYLLKF